MTSEFKMYGSTYLLTTGMDVPYTQGYNIFNHNNRVQYVIPPITGEAIAAVKREVINIIKSGFTETQYLGFILRHDQVPSFNTNLDRFSSTLNVSVELVHKSIDFCNTNYVGTGNYLNFYIYKVVKNG